MRQSRFCLLLLILQVIFFHQSYSSEHAISELIFQNYNKNLRPVIDFNTQLKVNISPILTWLIDVDEQNEALTYRQWLTLIWSDQFLSWDPALFYGTTKVRVPSTQIWTPDITILNANSINYIIKPEDTVVEIGHDGIVTVEFLQDVCVRCAYDLTMFPFDRQTCRTQYGSWSYPKEELKLVDFEPKFGLELIMLHPEWTMVDPMRLPYYQISQYAYESNENRTFEELHYNITIVRNASFYVSTLVTPSFIITMLCLIGVFSPTNSQGIREEKMTLGLTTLLTMAVLLNIITTEMPKSNKGLPLLGCYMMFEMIISAVGTCTAVFLMFLHERALSRGWTLPKWLGKVKYLESSRIRILRSQKTASLKKQVSTYKVRTNSRTSRRRVTAPDPVFDGEGGQTNRRKIHQQFDQTRVFLDLWNSMENLKKYLDEKSDREKMMTYWTEVFDICDFVCLLIFCIINIVVSLCMMFIK